jgi:hypothetical protein
MMATYIYRSVQRPEITEETSELRVGNPRDQLLTKQVVKGQFPLLTTIQNERQVLRFSELKSAFRERLTFPNSTRKEASLLEIPCVGGLDEFNTHVSTTPDITI